MDVVAIDDVVRTATIHVIHQSPFVEPSQIAQILFGITNDGSGLYLIGNKVHRVPPRGLANAVIEKLLVYIEATDIQDTKVRSQLQREALGAMTRTSRLNATTSHPPVVLLLKSRQPSRTWVTVTSRRFDHAWRFPPRQAALQLVDDGRREWEWRVDFAACPAETLRHL